VVGGGWNARPQLFNPGGETRAFAVG
jgi:hypothetical protein